MRNSLGQVEPLEAVIDKDRTSSLLAQQLGADRLFIATNVEKACRHYDMTDQENIDTLTETEARQSISQGEFGRGSMLPKIEAATNFVAFGGKEAVIGHLHQLSNFHDPNIGTHIRPDSSVS